MKVVPGKWIPLFLACLIAAGALIPGWYQRTAAAAENLDISAVAVGLPTGQIELCVSWKWAPGATRRWPRDGEDLLAVSFDTHSLVFEAEEAPLGTGASGETLSRLDRLAGADGSRRHFVIPGGADGSVRIVFRPIRSGTTSGTKPFRVYVVFHTPSQEIWLKETYITPS